MTYLVEKDFLEVKTLIDPFDFYSWAHENAPIIKMPGQNLYGIFSAKLTDEVLLRHDDFSNDFANILGGRFANDPEVEKIMATGFPHINVLLSADQPIHTQQRKLVNMAFSKPRVDAMADDIRQIVVDLVESFADKGACEFNEAFAIPLPVRIIANIYGLTGIPIEDVKRWSDAIADRAGGIASREREIECARNIVEFQHAMIERINARRANPEAFDDLLNDLVNAKIEGDVALSDTELLAILQQLTVAGNETTTAMLAMGLLMLIRNPEWMEELRADPKKIPAAVEEMLRFDGPAAATHRRAAREVELGGVKIPKGATLMVRFNAANRDAAAFDAPDKFDPARKNVHRHYGFGKGIHTCLGSMLARRELTTSFEELLSRLDNFALADEELSYHPAS